MPSRIKKALAVLQTKKIDALLVTKDVNIRYLTKFPAEDAWLFLTTQGSFYITDARYTQAAKKGLKGVKVCEYRGSIIKTLFQLARLHKVKKIGIDGNHMALSLYKCIKALCPRSVKITIVNNIVESLREIKEAGEIKLIQRALKYHQEALQIVKRAVKPGNSEKEVLLKLKNFIQRKDVGFSFDPIIASGPNSCYPHAKVTSRKIRNHEPVLIDMGIDEGGYKSDLTRMIFLGKISNLIQEINKIVFDAQQAAIQIIKPGIKASEVDRAARNYLAKHKLDKYFGHGLGHGVGLEIHESPSLSHKNHSLLKEHMIITIEPAVYLPNNFGLRLEEMVCVTKKGCKVLSAHIH